MKIVSIVVFTAALIVSWQFTHHLGPMSQSVHMGVQADLKKIIAEYVEKNLPDSKNLRFDRFWTESISETKIKATFAYTFDEPGGESGTTAVSISGFAILNKTSEDAQGITYSLDELKILDSAVEFDEPIQITTGPEGAEPTAIDSKETETTTPKPAGSEVN